MIKFIKRILNVPFYTKGITHDQGSYKAYLYIPKTKERKKDIVHIGRYKTKEEAIKARYKFINNLI